MATFYKDGKTYMYCPKCGVAMAEDARFCIHCGYINFDNEKNAFLKKYAQKTREKHIKFDLVRDKKFYETTVSTSNTFDPTKKTPLEIRYKIQKTITDIIVLIALIIGGYYGYNFVVDKQGEYIDDANKLVDYVKNNVHTCGNVYYFSFDENVISTNSIDVKSPYFGHDYFGYVMVVNNDGNKKYFIAMSDGTFGIREKNIEEVKKSNVLPYFGNDIKEVGTTGCQG